jgi:hypothetical protein
MVMSKKILSRVHEVRYFYVKSLASSYIKLRLLMYELAGRHPLTSLTLYYLIQKITNTNSFYGR